MAFVRKTWQDRISAYPNRRTITDGVTSKVVTVSRNEGAVTQEGDAFTAANMNDLEDRIAAAVIEGGGAVELVATITPGYNVLTFYDPVINENSVIEVFEQAGSFIDTVPYEDIYVDTRYHLLDIYFPPLENDVTVKVRIS